MPVGRDMEARHFFPKVNPRIVPDAEDAYYARLHTIAASASAHYRA